MNAEDAKRKGEEDGTRAGVRCRDAYAFGDEHDAAANAVLTFAERTTDPRARCTYVAAYRKAFLLAATGRTA